MAATHVASVGLLYLCVDWYSVHRAERSGLGLGLEKGGMSE